MSVVLTYDSIHLWRENAHRSGISARIAAFFSFARIEKWLAKRSTQQVAKIHDLLSEAYDCVQRDSSALDGVTIREFDEFGKLVNRLTKLHDIHERANFFEDKKLKSLLESTLQLSYCIEAEMRVKAFKGKKRKPTDDDFKLGLAEASKNSISGRL